LIFIDTSFFFAVFSDRDRRHAQAMECLAGFKTHGRPSELFLTTNHVVFETIALARSKAGYALAVTAGEELLSGGLARIHHASPEEERAAFEYLKKHSDKDYSAVDCLSFVLMLKLGITEALAFDEDFAHRFIVRPENATR
jgi:predicted nucleic acid-binding protein